MPNIASLLRDHVSLSVTCVDRLYVNGYVPSLQTPGQLYRFFHDHQGYPIVSPALFRPLHDRFVTSVKEFAEQQQVPLIGFERGQRKDDVAAAYRRRFDPPEGVVFIGVAQERAWSFKAHKEKRERGEGVRFDFSRQPVSVNHYYFYVQDAQWGPAFVKVCPYLPYPIKLCLNGHEWAKQQLKREGIGFESLDNGFRSCQDPQRLQQLCNQLGASEVQGFFERWSHRLPWPLTPEDRAAGYDHNLSLWQMEVSLTQVFEHPVQGRHFFEEVIRENLDLGRPDRVSLLFPTRHTRRTPPPAHGYRTRIITQGVNPSLHVEYKRSHIKQYFKENQALRTETTINAPEDFRINKGIENMAKLKEVGESLNQKLIENERVGQNCVLTQEAFDQLQKPRRDESGRRIPALRFGEFRVMALLQVLCGFVLLPQAFRQGHIRAQVASLLGLELGAYHRGKMTYDLRRLRLQGLIERLPGTHRYQVTAHGLRVALFYTKVHLRILRPGWAALVEPPPDPIARPLREALARVHQEVQKICDDASLRPAA